MPSVIEVIINGVRYVPAASANKDEPCFAVGDFVKLVNVGDRGSNLPNLQVGDHGKVVCVSPNGAIGVEFAKPFEDGHNLDGLTTWGHGRWFRPDSPSDQWCSERWRNRHHTESISQLEKV